MDDAVAKGLGVLSALGGVLAVVVSVPSRWFGAPQTDAYLFDPPLFGPLWIERTLVPVLTVVAGVLLVVGVGGLVARDRRVAGRLRRYGGSLAVAGLSLLAVGLALFAAVGGFGSGGQLAGALVVLLALLVVLLALALALPALVATGAGYARTERPVVGYALVGGPLLTTLAIVVSWTGALDGTGVGALSAVVPFGATFVVVGYELWTRAEAVPERGEDATRADVARESDSTVPHDDHTDDDHTDDDGATSRVKDGDESTEST